MDDLSALSCATDEFRRRLAEVGADQWTSSTPCDDWNVTALVEHVTGGNRMSELLLAGADAPTALDAVRSTAGAEPRESFEETSAAQIAAFAAEGALAMTVHHPAMDMTGDLLLMFRTLDLALHAQDLAAGIDADLSLDPNLCASLWTRLEPIAPLLSGSGMFGTPKRELGAVASAQDTLLNATGR
jgi:uncharacterized protein (TIGR03086 family)